MIISVELATQGVAGYTLDPGIARVVGALKLLCVCPTTPRRSCAAEPPRLITNTIIPRPITLAPGVLV